MADLERIPWTDPRHPKVNPAKLPKTPTAWQQAIDSDHLFYSDSPETIREGRLVYGGKAQIFLPNGQLFRAWAKANTSGDFTIRAFAYHLNKTKGQKVIVTGLRNDGAAWAKVRRRIYRPPGLVTESSVDQLRDVVRRYLAQEPPDVDTYVSPQRGNWYLLSQYPLPQNRLCHFLADFMITPGSGQTHVAYTLVTKSVTRVQNFFTAAKDLPDFRLVCETSPAHTRWKAETRREALFSYSSLRKEISYTYDSAHPANKVIFYISRDSA
jgi:hypothetical protein